MVLRSCFLQQTTTCGILLVLVCALVDCPHGEYGLRSLRFQGFFARRNLVRSGCRPVCCSSVGICYSFLLQYQGRRSAVVFLCSFEHGSVYAWVLLRKCRLVCGVFRCRRLSRGYLLWFSYAVIIRRGVLQCVCGLVKAGHHNRKEARLMLRPQRA